MASGALFVSFSLGARDYKARGCPSAAQIASCGLLVGAKTASLCPPGERRPRGIERRRKGAQKEPKRGHRLSGAFELPQTVCGDMSADSDDAQT